MADKNLKPATNVFTAKSVASRKGPSEVYSGDVTINRLAIAETPGILMLHRVTFAPNARTVWHKHPKGQILHCLLGVGEFQREGEEIVTLMPGDTVLISPNERHWHGASADQVFVHLAVNADNDPVWQEQVIR